MPGSTVEVKNRLAGTRYAWQRRPSVLTDGKKKNWAKLQESKLFTKKTGENDKKSAFHLSKGGLFWILNFES